MPVEALGIRRPTREQLAKWFGHVKKACEIIVKVEQKTNTADTVGAAGFDFAALNLDLDAVWEQLSKAFESIGRDPEKYRTAYESLVRQIQERQASQGGLVVPGAPGGNRMFPMIPAKNPWLLVGGIALSVAAAAGALGVGALAGYVIRGNVKKRKGRKR